LSLSPNPRCSGDLMTRPTLLALLALALVLPAQGLAQGKPGDPAKGKGVFM